jgi:hypothetical protein
MHGDAYALGPRMQIIHDLRAPNVTKIRHLFLLKKWRRYLRGWNLHYKLKAKIVTKQRQ